MSETPNITPEGHQRLAEEHQKLWHEERPRVVNEVAEAAAHGDRSENAEYKYGKQRLREIDSRMRYLSKLLDDVKIVDPSKIRSDVVQFGATVHLEDEDGKARKYQIVGVNEVDVKAGRISTASPVGKGLLGKKAGDIVVITRPRGDLEVEIIKIEYI